MESASRFYQEHAREANRIIESIMGACPIVNYERKNENEWVYIIYRSESRLVKTFVDEETCSFYILLLEHARTLVEFNTFLKEFLSLKGNEKGLIGIGGIIYTVTRYPIAVYLVEGRSDSPHATRALKDCIVRKDKVLLKMFVKAGVSYGPQEIEDCRNLGYNDIVAIMDIPVTKGVIVEDE